MPFKSCAPPHLPWSAAEGGAELVSAALDSTGLSRFSLCGAPGPQIEQPNAHLRWYPQGDRFWTGSSPRQRHEDSIYDRWAGLAAVKVGFTSEILQHCCGRYHDQQYVHLTVSQLWMLSLML